jgi:putative transcriptional regulator
MNMTRVQFARRFGFAVATLRHWEDGSRTPSGAALVLLNVIWRDPRAVMRALRRPTSSSEYFGDNSSFFRESDP